MVQYRAIERFGRSGEAAGGAAVGLARARIAAWMIVREHDPRTAVLRSVGDDRPQGKRRARLVARIALHVHAPRVIIDMSHPQALAHGIRVRHAAGKEFPGCHEAVELQREFGTLIPHRAMSKRSGGCRLFETHPKRPSNLDRKSAPLTP